jgi:hypothetical protein
MGGNNPTPLELLSLARSIDEGANCGYRFPSWGVSYVRQNIPNAAVLVDNLDEFVSTEAAQQIVETELWIGALFV